MDNHAISDSVLGCLLEPALTGLAAQLGSIDGLTEAEALVLHEAAAEVTRQTVRLRTNRVLLVELNAARISGRLTAGDPQARWREWEERAATPRFWTALAEHYPTLLPRLERVIGNRCAAALSMARRFAADRELLSPLLGPGRAELLEVAFGAGDSHRGGQTVALLRCTAGLLVYKPRSVAVDVALNRLLSHLRVDIRVPRVVSRDGYGWTEHITHRYCAGDDELRAFYRNLGHWLAVMRLVGGSDLHQENLIAAGPVPVVVDCETLFTPHLPFKPTGYGLAADRASLLVGGSVLGTGLLPGRGLALGWRGVDQSAIGSLPGQQPAPKLPMIVDEGTDHARIERVELPVAPSVNHPSENPVLGEYWDQIVDGFSDLTDRLRGLDQAGELEPLLAAFADLPVRVVARSTEIYAELGRMLWHPHALHDEPTARRRASDLLAKQSHNLPGRPSDPAVIEAEVEDLLDSDVPFFSTTPRKGRLTGPRGTRWGQAEDLIEATLTRWRTADFVMERQVIEAALVGAYLNEGWLPDQRALLPSSTSTANLDRRRRRVAASIVGKVVESAIKAEDGTVTWIAPVLNPTGWAVLPLGFDMYGGSSGIAVLLTAYQHEVDHGRADPVPQVQRVLHAILTSARMAEDKAAEEREAIGKLRPAPAGGYLGIASRIWGWLLLGRLGAVDQAEALTRAAAFVPEIATALTADASLDLVRGMAGAVVPLIRLGELESAADIGQRLVAAAEVRDGTARWNNPGFPDGLGGLAHGGTGIAWALARLGAVTGDSEAAGVAEAGFAYEETLYDQELRGWLDLREPGITAAAWCHGAGGIGVVAADLLGHGERHSERHSPQQRDRQREVLRRAAAACHVGGMGWNHTLCHGDLGAWEVLDLAISAGVGPQGLEREQLDAHVIGSLEEYGPVSGFARDVFAPGLLPGLGGVAYQLLRMHPECTAPSVLLPDPGPVDRW